MTRKHFVALAKALRDNNATPALVAAVADVAQASNPEFNRQRFLAAALGL